MLSIRIGALSILLGLALTACSGASPKQGTTGGDGASGTTGGGNSLQGLLAFAPDTVLVFVGTSPTAGGGADYTTTIDFIRSSPGFTCADYGGQFKGLLYDDLDITLQESEPISAGTYPIDTTGSICFGKPHCNLVSLYGATDPPSSVPLGIAAGVDGGITLTRADTEYAGYFSATVAFEDGGESTLSGTFDTTTICNLPE